MAVVLALLIGDITARMAATDANAQLAVDELTEVRVRSHAFWDNPMQRLLYRDMAVTDKSTGTDCGSSYTVVAYTLCGLPVDCLVTDECGAQRD